MQKVKCYLIVFESFIKIVCKSLIEKSYFIINELQSKLTGKLTEVCFELLFEK